MSKRIGEFIAERRKEKKLTQEQLAEKLGVSSKSISRWENNVTMPDLLLLPVVAKELEVEVSEIINGRKMSNDELLKMRETINRLLDYSSRKNIVNKNTKKIIIKIGLFVLTVAIIIVASSSFGLIKSYLYLDVLIILLLGITWLILSIIHRYECINYDIDTNNINLSETSSVEE